VDARVVVLADEVAERAAKSGLMRRVAKRLRNLCLYRGTRCMPSNNFSSCEDPCLEVGERHWKFAVRG
jgi:hypothetical protein